MNDINNLDRANEIKQDLRDLEYFVKTVCDLPHPDKHSYFKTNSIFKIKILSETKRSISVFGKRPFSPGNFSGSQEEQIKIPYSLIPVLRKEAEEQIKELEEEFKEL